jgi:hypothetical protein
LDASYFETDYIVSIAYALTKLNMKRKRGFLIAVAIMSAIICSCQSKIDIMVMETHNPVSYVFNLPVNSLRDTIINLFTFENQYENKYLINIFSKLDSGKTTKTNSIFYVETSKKPVIAEEYFEKRKSGAENDLYIHNYNSYWKSKVYFSEGKPMEFVTPFVLHFKEIDKSHTMLTVEAIEPVVVSGYDGLSYHGPKRKEQKVRPTSIEEYALILYIASKLGEKDLPSLILPH